MIKLGNNNIGKIYLGSNPIGKAYLGSNLVFQKGSQPSQSIPYIRGGGSGGSYIDTGITADNTVKIIVWARNWNPAGTGLFGCREAATQNAFFINSPSISSGNVHVGGINVGYGNSNSTYADDQFTNLGGYHKYELYQGVLKIDDVTVATGATSTFSNSLNIHIVGFNNNGTHSTSAFPIDICKVSIWKNDTLVRNLTPVDSPSVGMYDSVSDTVFTNAGSGSLTYGEFNMAGYTPLEYVACVDANAYIDTGIYGSNTTEIVTKIRPGGTSTGYRWLLGARTSGPSNILEFEIGGTSLVDGIYYMNFGTSSTSAETVLYNTSSLTGDDIVWIKTGNVSRLYKNQTLLGTATVTAQTFTTDYTMAIGARNNAGTFGNGFRGRIYYVGLGASGSYVPMLHNGVAGLYEMYSDTFYPSESANPFVAGPTIKLTHYFQNKNITIIGDSISTYDQSGYKYDTYSMYYPAGDVDSVDKTYWKQLIDGENGTLVENLSFSGSCAAHRDGGPSGGYKSLYDRASLIGNCDTVIIALGVNDAAQSIPLGDYSYDKTISQLDENYFREAYIKGVKQIQATRPNAAIVCVSIAVADDYATSIREIANHYGLKFLRIVSADYTKQAGLHPDYNGMRTIYRRLLSI